MSTPHYRHLCSLIACASGLALMACQQSQVHRSATGPHGRAIVMDGHFNDWPQNTASMADEHFLYFRVTVEAHGMPLQAAPETVSLWLDVDGDDATGFPGPDVPEAAGMGVDLMIEFSPPSDRPGRLRRGVAVYAAGEDGERIALTHAQVDLLAAPTHAAGACEIRIARHIDSAAPHALRNALVARGQGRSMFVVADEHGEITGWSDPESFGRPIGAASTTRADLAIPGAPEGALRILSWNVKDNLPLSAPAPFARTIQALQPDVILFQEMWGTDESTLHAWFTSVVTGDIDWAIRTPPGGEGGVAIISRYSISPLGPDRLTLPSQGNQEGEHTVRFIGATIEAPQGPLAVSTVHLKCCGTAGSSEDQRRLAEARAINLELAQALEGSSTAMRLIAGDFNLVGSREPLDILRANLDVDGGQLRPVDAMVLGDAAMYTWFDPASEFSAGRLDWAVFGPAGAQIVQAFTIDGRRLSPSSLARSGLDPRDSAASDHLPMVIDIRPR